MTTIYTQTDIETLEQAILELGTTNQTVVVTLNGKSIQYQPRDIATVREVLSYVRSSVEAETLESNRIYVKRGSTSL